MAKLPWMQFYPSDYLLDTQPLSIGARGIWMDLICMLWRAEPRGELSYRIPQWQSLLRCTQDELVTVLEEFKTFAICDIVTNGNGYVTLSSRRMTRDENARKNTRLRVQRHRSNKASNAQVRLSNRYKSEVISHKSESEVKEEGDKEHQPPALSVEEIRLRWNAISGVKPCKVIAEALQKKIQRLSKEHEAVWWENLFAEITKSKFLTGKIPGKDGKRSFRIDLDWATGPINLGKILAGNYDDGGSTPPNSRGVL